jgi:hypothetical protein
MHRPWPAEKPNPFAGAVPKGGPDFFRAERELKKRRELWGDKVKPERVTDHQWECRRLLEVEWMTQTAAAKSMGISQPTLRENAIKAGWVKKPRR